MRRLMLVALLATAPAVLPGLAYATLPDPSWIRGIYDDADYDDVVTLVTSVAGDVPVVIVADSPPIRSLVATLPPLVERVTIALAASPSRPRAPPAS